MLDSLAERWHAERNLVKMPKMPTWQLGHTLKVTHNRSNGVKCDVHDCIICLQCRLPQEAGGR